MSEKFTSDLFDIKNDRRLSVYLYRAGFGCWLLYIASGARFLHSYAAHRTDFGIFAFFLMVMGASASMVYDYHHDPAGFDQKKKWLIIGYAVLAGLIYFILPQPRATIGRTTLRAAFVLIICVFMHP